MSLSDRRIVLGATLMRVAAASVFVAHGVARAAHGTVGNFGSFLESWGFPAGGMNGAEYSALIIATLAAVALTNPVASRLIGAR
jgi:uncharacterized membrane protein YphA (DoxX/SURF4 family)